MRLLRPLMSVLLAALLALTSVTMAVARVQDRMSGTLELCADGAVQTIAVDGQGKPVGPHHVCPDCLMGVTALLPPQAAQELVLPQRASRIVYRQGRALAQTIATPQPSARGPPDLI